MTAFCCLRAGGACAVAFRALLLCPAAHVHLVCSLLLFSPSFDGVASSSSLSARPSLTVCRAMHCFVRDTRRFLENWLKGFPKFAGRDLYISGESYAGHCTLLLVVWTLGFVLLWMLRRECAARCRRALSRGVLVLLWHLRLVCATCISGVARFPAYFVASSPDCLVVGAQTSRTSRRSCCSSASPSSTCVAS